MPAQQPPPPGRTAAVVPAAGRGERLGPGGPKALRLLAGEPLLVHAVRSLGAAAVVDLVVVAAPPDDLRLVRQLLDDARIAAEVRVVAGGGSRRASVQLALLALDDDVDVVLVHDAARPLVPAEVVQRVAAAVRAGAPAVVPVLPVTDTIKQVGRDGRVERTVDRSALRAVQTPQGFRPALLRDAHAVAGGADVTDDAGLVEAAGGTVTVVDGHEQAFKVTWPLDLVLAEAVLALRARAGAG